MLTTQLHENEAAGDSAFTVSKTSRQTSNQNLHFVDGDTPWSYDIKSIADDTTKLAGYSDAELSDFLSRPVKIADIVWNVNKPLVVPNCNPWELFYSNPDVEDKIRRFRNLRSNLKIKVVLNGNSFYYGRAILSYNPYTYGDEVTVTRSVQLQDVIGASQKPHILLDPTSSQGGEMLLPFIWPENYLDITRAGAYKDMGTISILQMAPLSHANGATAPVHISIFCWAENLTLAVPTTNEPQTVECMDKDLPTYPLPPRDSYENQSGKQGDFPLDKYGVPKTHNRMTYHDWIDAGMEKEMETRALPPSTTKEAKKSGDSTKKKKNDEASAEGKSKYKQQADMQSTKSSMKYSNSEFSQNGLISKPASAVASAANALSMIPVLSPYAKATSMVSTRIGQIAKIFGYSRPQVLQDAAPYVPRFLGNLCNSDAPEPLIKLSLDSKNEMSIDTRLMGLGGHDELAINSICQRWSYFKTFDWKQDDVPDKMLASMLVSPIYVDTVQGTGVTELHPTALAFGSSPFDAWQGTIKFRFNVICSEYHRGRLRIVYNPTTSPTGPLQYNQTYSTVIDISENRDFEYEVKWADIRAWCKNIGYFNGAHQQTFATDVPISAGGLYDNGSLSIYVVNSLALPSSLQADIKIQVWVAAGDDFAVAVPTAGNLSQFSPFKPQTDIAPETLASSEDMTNAPTSVDPIPSFGGGEMIKEDNQYLVYQGERIVSFRELLRRYQYFTSYWPAHTEKSEGGGPFLVRYTQHDFPYYRGWEGGGSDLAVTSDPKKTMPYNFCTTTLLNYLTPAFACRRGAMRHKYVLHQLAGGARALSMSVSRRNLDYTPNTVHTLSVAGSTVAQKRAALQASSKPSLAGTHATCTNVQPVLEFETPYYSYGQRFEAARSVFRMSQSKLHSHDLVLDVPYGVSEADMRLDRYVSVGEDFQLGMFVGAPIVYSYVDPKPV